MDVAIIGAGIFGLSAAWALQMRGCNVTVYDGGTIGSGSSGGLVGALAPHMPEKWNPKKAFQFAALTSAQSFWDEIESISGLSSGYARIGRALPLRSERLRNQALVRAQEVPLLWKGAAKWDVVDSVDGCAPSSHGWVIETLSARLNPRQAVAALASALTQQGVYVRENSTIDPDQLPHADHVVIAAGAASSAFTPDFPAEFWSAVKGQSALLDVALSDCMPIVFEGGVYVVPHGRHGVAIGSTVEHEWDDPTSTDDQLHTVIERAALLVPALEGAAIKDAWAGIRPRARLPDPVVGQVPGSERHWLLAGGFKIGMGIGPHMGETLAKLICGEQVEVPPSFTLAHQLARCA